MSIRNLDFLMRPRSIALIGASRQPRSIGDVIARNLFSSGFEGPVMPVNPHAESIQGALAYPDVASLPVTPDLAVICTPPQTVPGLIADLGARGTKAAIVISAGFSELGKEGKALEQALLEAASPHLMRVLGPNCVGLLVPGHKLNASFAHCHAHKGGIAFLAQSGAIITSVLDWATARGIGFSHLVSMGGMADVDFGDLLDYLARDTATTAILLYVEHVTASRKFMSAARAASRLKPVVVIKAGRHAEAAKAAASHTGALAGADDVYTAAFRRAGMLRVQTIEELFDAVETLANAPKVRGNRLAIVSNGGGLGVLATDQLLDHGGTLACFGDDTLERLNGVLPRTWSHDNPVDLIGDATGERYEKALDIVLSDPDVDAALILNCPVAVADSLDAAQAVVKVSAQRNVPLFTSWLGEASPDAARKLFAQNGIASYPTPDRAVRGFMHIVRYQRNQALLMETPEAGVTIAQSDRNLARTVVETVLKDGRDLMSEPESKALLAAYGVPTVTTAKAPSIDEAVAEAGRIGYPVAVKILSHDISHKSDAGGVALSLSNEDALREACETMLEKVQAYMPEARLDGFTVQEMVHRPGAIELITGLIDDPTFGPVVLFGQGGTAVEVIDDKAMALLPLNRTLASDLIKRTNVFRLLQGYRDRPAADLKAVVNTLMRLGEMAADLPEIQELDINPLLADAHGVLALDARIRVAPAASHGTSRFAIEPYPRALETPYEARDGTTYLLRPVKPEDEPAVINMIESCDARDIRMRFFSCLRQIPHHLGARLTQIDYDREMAFVAAHGENGQIDGIARFISDPDFHQAEYAILVRSSRKGTGLGMRLMQAVIVQARQRGIREIIGDVLRDNTSMLALCSELGFIRRAHSEDPQLVEVALAL